MLSEKSCLFCKLIFTPKYSTQKYCNEKCSIEAKRGVSRPEVGPAISKAKKGKPSPTKGMTYEEIGRGPSPLTGKTFEEIGRDPSPLIGRTRPPEVCVKIGLGNLNKLVTSETRQLLREINLGKVHGPASEETKQKQREAALRRILEGKSNPADSYGKTKKKRVYSYKAGYIQCDSSWEAAYVRYLDLCFDVETFEKGKIRIAYIDSAGKNRVYITDFLVHFFSGKKSLIEVKPECMLSYKENPAKLHAARTWCKDQGVEFVLVTDKEIMEKNGGKLPISFREQERIQARLEEIRKRSQDEEIREEDNDFQFESYVDSTKPSPVFQNFPIRSIEFE